jgi:hypothetical protein
MEIEKFKSIINDIENSPNKDLTSVMDFINEDFVKTKNSIINLTFYLDNLEITYNKVLKEYQKRNNENR